MANAAPGKLRPRKYTVLLAMLLASIVIQSFRAGTGLDTLLFDGFTTALGITIFLIVFEDTRERTFSALVLIGLVGLGWARYVLAPSFDHALSVVHQALAAIFFWTAVAVILRKLFSTPSIGTENVRGAICGYIIAGAAWASVNALTYLLVPSSYSFSPQVTAFLTDWHGRVALFSYYSFAQMLTIGYADVTPVRAPATTLSLLAALFGVFYTAVVVSQLVGMAQSRRREGSDSP